MDSTKSTSTPGRADGRDVDTNYSLEDSDDPVAFSYDADAVDHAGIVSNLDALPSRISEYQVLDPLSSKNFA